MSEYPDAMDDDIAAEVDPRPGKLFEARQMWALLLRSGTPCDSNRWRAWADSYLRGSIEVAPPWLIALATARTRDEAIEALGKEIGLDMAEFPGQVYDHDAMTIGFVFARFLDGELSREQMWAEVRRVVDIAAFIDAAEWQRWHGIKENDPEDPLAENAGWIQHLAWLAVRGENELLRGAEGRRPDPRPCWAT